MFLSTNSTFKLDKVIKGFEVAYRSYVSESVINNFHDENKFLSELNSIDISNSSLINSGKYSGKLTKMKTNYKDIYKSIKYSYECMINKDIIKAERAIYVSDLIDIIIFLSNPYFNDLNKNFETKNQFIYYSEVYQNIRNDLSHPATAKISFEDTKIIMLYIIRLMDIMEESYFWFVDKNSIKEDIEQLTENINKVPIAINNFNEIAVQYKKVIGREKELDILNKWILGEEGSYRTANSVVIYGYGGIGKTTLVVEFMYELTKRITDNKITDKYKYMLFFSSKDEKLDIMHTNDKLYIDDVRQQIASFDDFINSIRKYLSIQENEEIYEYMNNNNGIIIIDNIENLKEKEQLIDFIKRSPRSVQYIVTSRNEEMCEEKLNVIGFDNKNNGEKFIDEYIEANHYDLVLSSKEKQELIKASIGNTLILVTSLERIQSGKSTINTIINELMNISSYNTRQIADFMYKNTFDQTLEELKSYKVEKLLQVIALYEEAIDLYAMSELAQIAIKDVEYMCEILTTKLVLYKVQDLFRLNDFASKFIFSKILPERIELLKLKDKINKYKADIKYRLDKLDMIKNKDRFLEEVMNDWKPQNNTDKITIANAFTFYSDIKRDIWKNKGRVNREYIQKKLDYVEKEFKKYELKTGHPYIRYQKARVYKLFIDSKIYDEETKKIILGRMKNYFEEAKFSVELYYQYIKGTLSYAAFLWIYGTFLRIYINDNTKALNVLVQSKEIYDELGINDINHIKMCNELAKCYLQKYKESKEQIYLDKCKEICREIIIKEDKFTSYTNDKKFDFRRFRNEFRDVI